MATRTERTQAQLRIDDTDTMEPAAKTAGGDPRASAELADPRTAADGTSDARGGAIGTGLEVDFAALLRTHYFGEPAEAPETLPPPINGGGSYVAAATDTGPLVLTPMTLYGSDGDDVIHGSDYGETILGNGTDGWDALALDDDVLYGHGGDDILIGGFGDDNLDGGDGNDQLYGGWGDDVLHGGAGHDTLDGGGGNDTLYNDGGFSTLLGGMGADALYGSDDAERFQGGDHDDVIDAAGGNDVIWGDDYYSGAVPGDDTIFGGGGDDIIDAHMGNDTADGGAGDDTLFGGPGADILLGGDDDDILVDAWSTPGLDSGNDILDGGAGNDILVGRGGANLMTGGDGADTFLASIELTGGGPFALNADFSFNTIADYNAADGDVVQGFSAISVGTATHVLSDTNQLLFVLTGHDLATDGLNLIWT
ncbi:MAG: calcium-binding protein [Alphaproteobacteria bacterium]